jgi:hypothetical protein
MTTWWLVGVPVVLGLFGDGVVAGGDQGGVHCEHGVLGEPVAGLESEHRSEMVDDPVCLWGSKRPVYTLTCVFARLS